MQSRRRLSAAEVAAVVCALLVISAEKITFPDMPVRMHCSRGIRNGRDVARDETVTLHQLQSPLLGTLSRSIARLRLRGGCPFRNSLLTTPSIG
jgi:hypothetical protein